MRLNKTLYWVFFIGLLISLIQKPESEDESNSLQHFVREFFILILPKGAISLRKDLKCL
jgi:hypothetical protein